MSEWNILNCEIDNIFCKISFFDDKSNFIYEQTYTIFIQNETEEGIVYNLFLIEPHYYGPQRLCYYCKKYT